MSSRASFHIVAPDVTAPPSTDVGASVLVADTPKPSVVREQTLVPQPPHIPALDALRGIAVLMILARHASAVPTPEHPVAAAVIGAMRTGWMGVDLFFALSGFLITGILIDTRGTPGFLRNFYARRTLRIFPLYFSFLALLFVVGPLTPLARMEEFQVVQQNQGWLWSYLTNVLIAWQGEAAVPFHLGHLWSLALEEQFYLVWPFVVLLIPARSVLRACLLLSAAAVALRFAMVMYAGWGIDAAYMLMPARLDALLLGGALAWLVRSREGRVQVSRLLRPLGAGALIALAAVLITRGGEARNDPYMQLAGYLALSLLAVVLIATALPGASPGPWRRVLANRTLQSIGKYSYAVYVFQYPIIFVIEQVLYPAILPATGGSPLLIALVTFVLATLLSVAAARVSWILIEAPALSLKRYFPRRAAA